MSSTNSMEETPPFKAEYAKSDRASCKGCFVGICKDDLRMAEMVQVRLYCIVSCLFI